MDREEKETKQGYNSRQTSKEVILKIFFNFIGV